MKPKQVKQILLSEIKKVSDRADEFCLNPGKCFVRKRKLSFETVIRGIIGMESKSLTNELIDMFDSSPEMPSASAFVQQRSKIKPDAFKTIFESFTSKITTKKSDTLRILAVDGSDVQIATNPGDSTSYHPGSNGQKPYNLLHLNALYDLEHHIYTDAVIQGRLNWNEHSALQEMVDRSDISKALVVADRCYESYNNMAHIQEKGWYFLIRIKDGKNGIKQGLDLPDSDEFDEKINLQLTRKQTKETKELFKRKNYYKFVPSTTSFEYLPLKSKKNDPAVFYELNFRIVRFKVTDELYETVLTNLDKDVYPPEKLRELYASRWGIETSFRDLKYTIGLLHFHSKKVDYILQEIFAGLIMYNFSELITSHVVIEKGSRKYEYKINFSVAVHICRDFLLSINNPPDVELLIARYVLPIRPGRSRPREMKVKQAISFMYRIA